MIYFVMGWDPQFVEPKAMLMTSKYFTTKTAAQNYLKTVHPDYKPFMVGALED